MNYTYLWIDLFTIAGPLALSFDKKVAFYKKWKFLPLAIGIPGLAYIIWDMIFTRLNIWKFNTDFITGHYLYNLPLEEILFFIFIPYSCLFIYECLIVYFPKTSQFIKTSKWLAFIMLAGLCYVVFTYYDRLYTAITAMLLLFTLLNHLLTKKGVMLPNILLAWTIAIIPMLVVNGLLTGLPVLIYNNAHNTGIRLGSIPIEDFFYNLLLMIWMIDIYEKQLRRNSVYAKSSVEPKITQE